MFTSTRVRIQIEFARPTYPDSLSVRQLICNKAIFGSRENFIASLFLW